MTTTNKQSYVLSNFLLVSIVISFTWFYNAFLFSQIIYSQSFLSKLFFIPLFTFNKTKSFYFNYLFIFTTISLVYYFRCNLKIYSKKFFKSLKTFGALLQHYSVITLLSIAITPVIFHNSEYQKALLFNGDFIILPFLAIVIFFFIPSRELKPFIPEIQPDDEAPIKSFEEDLIDCSNLIASISQDILIRKNNSAAAVFGLFGPWGSGKTSIFYLLESHFNKQKDLNPNLGFSRLKIVRLNVHKYENIDKLYLYFFDELLTEIQKVILLPRLDTFFITKTLLLPFIKGIELDSLLNKIIPLPRLDEYLSKYSSWLVKMDISIICFIDDVDRLIKPKDIDAVLKLLNLVKHNMANIILFVAADPKIFNKISTKN